MKNIQQKLGFTLIEFSIVLVILGLIVGGILLGRDMIFAAEIRRVVTEKQDFSAAVNTFRVKYGYLPGDIPPYIAQSYGLFTLLNGGSPTDVVGQ